MKIVLMGTPYFALPTFKALIESTHKIISVYTKPPKPQGRGQEFAKTVVHIEADKYNIPVFTPNSLKNSEEHERFKNLNADVAIVAAYGLLLPKEILNAPVYGCINIHPSMLPKWRGAAPLQHTILNGDRETEVCIMQMDEGMDTGNIILNRHMYLDQKITLQELHDITSNMGADLILETLELIKADKATSTPQRSEGVTHARKLTKEDEKMNWHQTAFQNYCRIKTFAPRPGAYFIYKDEIVKIIEAEYDISMHRHYPGAVIDDKLSIACAHGIIKPTLLQREGRKMIYTDAFLRGFNIPKGSNLN